jgi:small subunit ribosomal protein S2
MKAAAEKRKKENRMAVISMKALLESGVHFGHRTHKWHPGMKPYIFTERNGIHIIDLQKTAKAIEQIYSLISQQVSTGGTLLFVGTKRQAQETIEAEAIRCGMPHVTNRWLGGTLTNWRTIRNRVNELERLERMRDAGEFSRVTKKEGLMLQRKIDRLQSLLGGLRNLSRLPDMLFVVDVQREDTAIHEANLLKIPVVAMVDTNCDPRSVDYIIPSNDDAIRAIKLIVGKVADAVAEGMAMRKDIEIEEPSRMSLMDETELAEEDLLGEATLAKLSQSRSSEEESLDEVIEDEGEVGEEVVADELEEEPSDDEAAENDVVSDEGEDESEAE